MKVLVACEESQTVCKEFRRLGHEAYSCDIQKCSGGHPEWHILGDAIKALEKCEMETEGGQIVDCGEWDLLIAHPPCTYLSNAGAARLYKRVAGKSYIERDRFEKGMDAKEFFLKFAEYGKAHRVAIENPVPSGVYRLPKYNQTIQPYEHGDPYSKKTCLWLYNLPQLKETNIVKPICSWVSGGSKKADGTKRENCGMKFRDAKTKSKTFPGIARAMAEQWGGVAHDH